MSSFYDQPILNSPYEVPTLHHALDDDGQPTDALPIKGRRQSKLIAAVPKAKKRKRKSADKQASMDLDATEGLSTEEQEYNPTPIINEIRQHVATWRAIPNRNDWNVTPATARLLEYWRDPNSFQGIRPFFCQVEAVETVIWLTEVAQRSPNYKRIWNHIKGANEQANPELLRLAMKMATGAGKTTVMAMLIAWQTVNSVRSPDSKLFTRGFLLIAPGITIRDRLRVLLPNDPDNYYTTRDLIPTDMLEDLGKAKIVITNYHAFQLKENLEVKKVGKSLLQGRHEQIKTTESEGQMVRRIADQLMGLKNIIVINDEAHHCYRERPNNSDIEDLTGDDKKEAKQDNEAARLWINGIEAFKRKLGVRAVYDLSATPFFLKGSGYLEGTLFPWTASDFSLMDAIECGIVKLPRIPVDDNTANEDIPVLRNLWDHVGGAMPKKGRGKTSAPPDPNEIPEKLQTALYALYGHYKKTFEAWKMAGIDVPPVFIVVCNNTSTSKLVYEWISGWDRLHPDDPEEIEHKHNGHLELFSNYDEHGNKRSKFNTLLIDSHQIESGEDISETFRKDFAEQIDQFKREKAQRDGAASAKEIADTEILREVMNTVGEKGRLGEQIRCVVSVSMLTEGWDTNTVTHILGLRAFGTQLLCEQVVGRGLRRYSYDLNEDNRFDVEYSDIIGIPFDFAASPKVSKPTVPKKMERVKAIKERAKLEVSFPRVVGYRTVLPNERLIANFNQDHTVTVTPDRVGPGETLLQGIVGKESTLTLEEAQDKRKSTIVWELAQYVMSKHFTDDDGEPKLHLMGQIKRIVREWLDDGHLELKAGAQIWMLQYSGIRAEAAEKIKLAIDNAMSDGESIEAVLDPYNPKGSSRHVGFMTSKDLYTTNPTKCHINYVVCDSDWEAEFARIAEAHDQVISYVKNQGLGFEVPYKDGHLSRVYVPDFIVQVDDGQGLDDPLNLIVEVKGYRNEDVKLKSETMRSQWLPGVNALGTYGRWAFQEFGDVYEMQEGFAKLIERVTSARKEEV